MMEDNNRKIAELIEAQRFSERMDMAAAPELYEALEDAQRKLFAYVGICKGDKELVGSILPKIEVVLAKARGEA